ncbi:radical SAM protein [Elusimicrobiota bacterium]
MKILLINPIVKDKIWAGIPQNCSKDIFLFPPLGLMYIEAYLDKFSHHQTKIIDALADNLSYDDITEKIEEFKPDIVGITVLTHNLKSVLKTINAVREANQNCHISIGGPHVTAYPNESIMIKNVDSALSGYCEKSFMDLANALEQNKNLKDIDGIILKTADGIYINENKQNINLDMLPFPDRVKNDFKRYYTPATQTDKVTTFISGRGCPQRCTFCNTYQKYESRSAINIADEIQYCTEIGVKEIYFIDDTFNVTIERVLAVANEILKRNLKIKWGFKARCDNINAEMLKIIKKAGCVKIHYGVETGSDYGLKQLNKKITLEQIEQTFKLTKKYGIRTIAFFMLGCPHDKTATDILNTVNFALKLKTDYAVFAVFSPYPDTISYKNAMEKGIIQKDLWKDFILNPDLNILPDTCWEEFFTKDELFKLLKSAHRKFYFRPFYILKTILNLHSFFEFKRILIGGISLLKIEFLNKKKKNIL